MANSAERKPSPEPQGPLASELRKGLGRASNFNWQEIHPFGALLCLPVPGLMLCLGMLSGNALLGLIAATGAFSVGFGLFQRLTQRAALPMILAAAGISVSAAIGTLASRFAVVDIAVAMLWAFGLGFVSALGTATWWIVLQWSIALVIAATFPADAAHALLRGALVAGGGVAQLAITLALCRASRCDLAQLAATTDGHMPQEPPAALWKAARDAIRRRSPHLHYAITLAGAVGIADGLFRLTGMSNGYWMPMTVLIVLRFQLSDTLAFSLARIAGSIGGAGVATLAAALLHPSQPWLAGVATAMAWLCYTSLRVNYGLFSFGVTAYVALLFAFAGLPEPIVALHRVNATATGGILRSRRR